MAENNHIFCSMAGNFYSLSHRIRILNSLQSGVDRDFFYQNRFRFSIRRSMNHCQQRCKPFCLIFHTNSLTFLVPVIVAGNFSFIQLRLCSRCQEIKIGSCLVSLKNCAVLIRSFQVHLAPLTEIPVLTIGMSSSGIHFVHNQINIRFYINNLSINKYSVLCISQMSALYILIRICKPKLSLYRLAQLGAFPGILAYCKKFIIDRNRIMSSRILKLKTS